MIFHVDGGDERDCNARFRRGDLDPRSPQGKKWLR